jgi:ATP synthase protein I
LFEAFIKWENKAVKRPKRPDRNDRHHPWHDFLRKIEDKANRKLKAREEEKFGIWYGLGLMGIVGWSVVIPTMIGVAVGIWLDARWSSPVPWTVVLMLVGLGLGCLNAWYWVQRESRDE